MRIAVIIPAAGRSKRFGSPGRDKLAEDLGGRALLLRTVELFNKREDVATMVVAGPPDSLDQFKMKFGDQLAFLGAKVVAGGRKERWETVQAALAAVPADCTHVVVHDAARPATSPELIDRVFEAARKFDAVIPAVPVTATLKRVGEKSMATAEVDPIAARLLGEGAARRNDARPVLETLDRAGVVEAQTPQIFKAESLRRAYAASDLSGLTDDAAAVERLGETVYAVEGDPRNLKVTTTADLALVRAIMGVRPPADRPAHKRF